MKIGDGDETVSFLYNRKRQYRNGLGEMILAILDEGFKKQEDVVINSLLIFQIMNPVSSLQTK